MKGFRIKTSKLDSWAENKSFSMIVLLAVVVIGILIRANFVAGSEFPLNDGGFFYRMTEDLIRNDFILPEFTTYNHADIPFAYPPLAFYLAGAVHKVFNVPLLDLFKYIPLVISCLTIPVFYAFTRIFLREEPLRLLALYLFVTLPRSFEWFVMGGGITRSLGFFFALIALTFIWKAFEDEKMGMNLIFGSLFSALTIISHPVASLFLLFSVVVFMIYNLPGSIKPGLVMAILISAVSSPWWGTVIGNHGLAPFLGAGNTGHLNWFEIKNLLTLNFGYENPYFLALASMLAIFGLFSARKRNALLLGILCGLGYAAIPRGGVDLLTAYLPILAAVGFEVISANWNSVSEAEAGDEFPALLQSSRSRILLAFLLVYVFLGAYTYKYVSKKSELRLDGNNVMAMEWLRQNGESGDLILLLPPVDDNRFWLNDYISEWLPALSDLESVSTVQGYEWKPNLFDQRVDRYSDLQNCRGDYFCITSWQENLDINASYIYLEDLLKLGSVYDEFLASGSYIVAYENATVGILESNSK